MIHEYRISLKSSFTVCTLSGTLLRRNVVHLLRASDSSSQTLFFHSSSIHHIHIYNHNHTIQTTWGISRNITSGIAMHRILQTNTQNVSLKQTRYQQPHQGGAKMVSYRIHQHKNVCPKAKKNCSLAAIESKRNAKRYKMARSRQRYAVTSIKQPGPLGVGARIG